MKSFKQIKISKIGLAFLAPAVLFILAFSVVPFARTFILSFQSWNGVGSPEYVGTSNFKYIFVDKVAIKSLFNSVYYALASTAGSVILGLFFATLLIKIKGREGSIIRMILYSPALLPIAVVGMMFTFFYNPTVGLVNQLLSVIGLESWSKVWLQDSQTAMIAIVVAAIWKNIGANMILCYASMQSIPNSLYEASIVDGAGFWRRMFKITYPLIKPMILLTTINTLGRQYKSYGLIYTMTNGGPGTLTTTVPITMIKTAFGFGYMGRAAAMGLVLTLVVTISILISKYVLRGEDYEY
jgi:ABC-type sugar transport system permease subunit